MNNSGWVKFSDRKPPDGCDALVFLKEPSHGSRYKIWSSSKILNGYMVTIGDHFSFDFSGEILCWKLCSEITETVPLEFAEPEFHPTS